MKFRTILVIQAIFILSVSIAHADSTYKWGKRLIGDSFDVIEKELDDYPGTVAAIVKDGEGRVLFSHDADRRLATGSSFKLFILKALIDDIKEGKRSWSDIIKLDERKFSLPSGILQRWSDGSPVTLYTLAMLMISISDNTAADYLIDLVGRERLEAMMPGSKPFLKTREMYVLKLNPSNHYLKLYLKSNLNEKRMILRRLEDFDLKNLINGPDTPISPDKVEWFASPDELADVILSMRGEEILSANSGVIARKKRWRFIGFKGGSEPGVLQLTQILQSKSGRWYAVSVSWNDTEKDIDPGGIEAIVNRLADLIK